MITKTREAIHTDSTQPQWEKYASVRSKPRRILLEQDELVYYFPPSRQPLCIHPDVMSLDGAINFILVQSCYKYMNDIANIETDIINQTAHKIARNHYPVEFSRTARHEALSIIIDESYHAYVALDLMEQISKKTGIQPLKMPTETELSKAIKKIKHRLPERYHDNFELIAVCIAEHVLTNDLISIANSNEISRTFYNVMHDHAMDEGRHSKYFSAILQQFWGFLGEDHKQTIGSCLPELIKLYLEADLQKEFDRQLLSHFSIPSDRIENILGETHTAIALGDAKTSNLLIKQVMRLLERTGVLKHPSTLKIFQEYELI